MRSIAHTQRYLPHELSTKYYAVKLYRSTQSVSFVCRRYKISKSSLMRWNKLFDGTKESLIPGSHRPHSIHPNSHTEEEMKWIKDYLRRNPHITLPELYGKLRTNKGYTRHPGSLYRVLRRIGYHDPHKVKKKPYIPKPYDTPKELGIKWQMDVKVVPRACYTGTIPDRYYQYTVIDEASRERFIYPYKEQSSYSTMDFLKRALLYYGYVPKIIQTDNGTEFTHVQKTGLIHGFDRMCNELGIKHQLIRPRTPRHNGKVERSHRNDNQRFYSNMHFYSYKDLLVQMKRYLRRSNNIPMQSLGWISPLQMRTKLEQQTAALNNDIIVPNGSIYF